MIRLLLVDDQSLVCQGLQAVLDQVEDLQVVGAAENGQVAIAQVASLQPDVVLMDIRMPVMTGIEATRLITEQFPNTKILVLSTLMTIAILLRRCGLAPKAICSKTCLLQNWSKPFVSRIVAIVKWLQG